MNSFNTQAQNPASIDIGLHPAFTPSAIHPMNEEYIARMVDMCRQHNIDLIMFTLPRLPGNTMAVGNYHEFHKYATDLAAQYGIPFGDLLYIREDVLKIEDTFLLMDTTPMVICPSP